MKERLCAAQLLREGKEEKRQIFCYWTSPLQRQVESYLVKRPLGSTVARPHEDQGRKEKCNWIGIFINSLSAQTKIWNLKCKTHRIWNMLNSPSFSPASRIWNEISEFGRHGPPEEEKIHIKIKIKSMWKPSRGRMTGNSKEERRDWRISLQRAERDETKCGIAFIYGTLFFSLRVGFVGSKP